MAIARDSLIGDLICLTVVLVLMAGCAATKPVVYVPPPAPAPAPAPIVAAPPPAPAPRPVPIQEKVAYGSDILFSPGKTTLDSDAKARLDDLVAKLSAVDLDAIRVVGHADNTGSSFYAQGLSDRRADAVAAYLESKGIELDLIDAEGRGNTQPVGDNRTTMGRRQNNRVEIEVEAVRGARRSAGVFVRKRLIPVLFATNRKPTGSTTPAYFYGNRMNESIGADSLRRGIAYVRIPVKRKRGTVKRSSWTVATIERSPLATTLAKFSAPDPQTDFRFEQRIEEMDRATFDKRMSGAIKDSKGQRAVLYIHGYANDFTDAAFRAAQISHDLTTSTFEIVPMMFSWPSDYGPYGMWYPEAKSRTDWAAVSLAVFLREIAATTDVGTIHIVAHSMGASVLVQAMGKLKAAGESLWQLNPNFRQIVFAAADVTPELFKTVIGPAIKNQHTVTNYISDKDWAIRASNMVNRSEIVGNYFRDASAVKCVDTVDVSAVALGGLGHSTWAESPRVLNDLRLIFRAGTEPEKRGLKKRAKPNTVWLFDRRGAVLSDSAQQPTPLPCE